MERLQKVLGVVAATMGTVMLMALMCCGVLSICQGVIVLTDGRTPYGFGVGFVGTGLMMLTIGIFGAFLVTSMIVENRNK